MYGASLIKNEIKITVACVWLRARFGSIKQTFFVFFFSRRESAEITVCSAPKRESLGNKRVLRLIMNSPTKRALQEFQGRKTNSRSRWWWWWWSVEVRCRIFWLWKWNWSQFGRWSLLVCCCTQFLGEFAVEWRRLTLAGSAATIQKQYSGLLEFKFCPLARVHVDRFRFEYKLCADENSNLFYANLGTLSPPLSAFADMDPLPQGAQFQKEFRGVCQFDSRVAYLKRNEKRRN